MAKIPFDIKYRDKIESGEYKVETESGAPAKIIDWEWNNEHTGVCLAVKITEKGKDTGCLYTEYGKRAGLFPYEKDSDLFIVTPKPTDMSEFGMKVSEFAEAYELAATDYESEEYKTCNGNLQLIIDKYAAELLALAEKEIAKRHEHDVYIPEDTYYEQLKKQWEEGYNKGKAKDLPKWRTIEEATTKRTDENDCVTTETMLVKGWMNRNDYRIVGPECMVNRKMLCVPVVELSKLPGFKEES